jgi:NNP family nitrate/nitrite transporter-like MFS transporter
MKLSVAQIRTIAICNVDLTVPARIIIGMLVDKFGPRITCSILLVYAAIPCLMFAAAQDFNRLVVARLLLSILGAGFVLGIRIWLSGSPPGRSGWLSFAAILAVLA